MTQVTMLSASQISHLLDMPSVIDAVADAYKEKANHPQRFGQWFMSNSEVKRTWTSVPGC